MGNTLSKISHHFSGTTQKTANIVVVVGMSYKDFSSMSWIDDFSCESARSKGDETTRNLVQFVKF